MNNYKKFFNIFGYTQIKFNEKRNIDEIFNQEIIDNVGHNYDNKENLRISNFKNDEIFNIFYNDNVLNKLESLFDDFFVLSDIESFYLKSSHIHRDVATELKHIKLLFYLDDLSDVSKGPLYVIPGTHNLYDKYSISLGANVQWPPPFLGGGENFINDIEFMNNNIPKTYLFSNSDNIIIFNENLFHGSDGNLSNPSCLRRAIGITLICADRNNNTIMNKIDNFYKINNVSNCYDTGAFKYCSKYNLTNWLKHFYVQNTENIPFDINMNRWKYYIDKINESKDDNENNTIYNCRNKELQLLNDINNICGV
jgi:hypothetical protein